MRTQAPILALMVILLSGVSIAVAQDKSPQPDGENLKQQTAVIHLSHFSDDLHRAFMALKIASMMQEGGVETSLFLDIEGARLSDSRQSLDVHWGPSPTKLGDLFDAFVKSGGKVAVCPHCAKAAGIAATHVRPGARIATEDELAALLIGADKIMDY
ncbi:DsrE family protein [Aureliella helgolandensis]|uniref:Uncharacterized protein n=1 Tax=Aureliella helgolandensis TaxID=2527968 RepID=A0A518GD09_9BACT|nr:DsrE family protein [Aureliella helgolandensis]QDV26481.1 hypothetical protein Q31a_48550 [Aureliella helgolandensis]